MPIADSRPWPCIALICCAQSACIVDAMPPDVYASTGYRDAAGSDPDRPSHQPHHDGSTPDDSPDTAADASTALDAGGDIGDAPPAPGCDLTGPWLITERLIATGLGAKQAAVWWLYYEIEQSGEKLRVKRGLVCGTEVRPVSAVSAKVDMRTSWPKIMERNSHAGVSGLSRPSPAGCGVSISRAPYVMGATMPYYQDKSHALPTLEQAASGSSPGWEDWDSDGKPGISLHVSGLANGVRYMAARTTGDWKGEIKRGAARFKLRSNWQQEEAVLGVTSDILKSTGTRDADPAVHFAQFAQLTPGQVSGDDATICNQIRNLAPMLTAEANE